MFEKGNKFGKGRKNGSKNKKTVVRESLERLNSIGITPLKTSAELIDSLTSATDLKNSEKISLLGLMTGLFKYEILSRVDELKLNELMTTNEVLVEENEKLKEFVGTPLELLKELKKGADNE